MKFRLLILLFLFFNLLNPRLGFGQEPHGAKLNSHYSDSGKQMELKGTSLKKMFFVKVFSAGFYLAAGATPQEALQNVSKRLEVTFLVHVPGVKLTKYAENMMQKNMTKEEYSLLGERIEKMAEYLVTLNPGDRYALTYIPGIGTKFEHNEKLVGIIPGEDFARGIFSVWIGENPIDRNVKKQILGLL